MSAADTLNADEKKPVRKSVELCAPFADVQNRMEGQIPLSAPSGEENDAIVRMSVSIWSGNRKLNSPYLFRAGDKLFVSGVLGLNIDACCCAAFTYIWDIGCGNVGSDM
ncbi:hypothetical protein EAE99_007714 [Botrytis elliptica]|nr:hypothetical protein EAE99_007714 [Botrytis elliptica]